MRLRSGAAMAVGKAGGHGSNSTPSLGTSVCRRCGSEKVKIKKKKKDNLSSNLVIRKDKLEKMHRGLATPCRVDQTTRYKLNS